MKKVTVLLLVICMVAGFAVAEDKGIGLTAGLELGFLNFTRANDNEGGFFDSTRANDGDMNLYLMPMLIYDNSFLDGALDVYAELDYKFVISKKLDSDGSKVFPQSLYVDLAATYNLKLAEKSTLSFALENEFDEIIIAPKNSGSNSVTGILTPAVKFNQTLDIGDLFAQIGLPITYIQYYKGANAEIGLDFTLGWNSTFGLGVEAKICTLLKSNGDSGYTGLEFTASYTTEPLYFEIETIIPKESGIYGVTITPEVDYSLKNFTFYVKTVFDGLFGKIETIMSPALGVKYSF